MPTGTGNTVGQMSCHETCCSINAGVILPGDKVVVDDNGNPYHRACASPGVIARHDRDAAIGARSAAFDAARRPSEPRQPTAPVSAPRTARPGGMSVAELQALHARQRPRADAGGRPAPDRRGWV